MQLEIFEELRLVSVPGGTAAYLSLPTVSPPKYPAQQCVRQNISILETEIAQLSW